MCAGNGRMNGSAWYSLANAGMPSWQIKNIADRSKNFHTHLFLFTARNLHIKAEQKDAPCCAVLCKRVLFKSLTLTQVKISENYAWL